MGTPARWIGLLATALFAVSLFQIRSAWEIRMYSLGTALSLFSSWLLLRALFSERPKGRAWTLYALAGLLFAYTHYFALFSLFAQFFFAAAIILHAARWKLRAVLRDARLRWLASAGAVMAAGWSPWLSVFLQQRQRVADGWNSGTFTLWHVPSICYQMFFHPDVHGSAPLYIATVALACCAALLVAAWRGSAGHWCVCCLAVVPFTLIALASGGRFQLDGCSVHDVRAAVRVGGACRCAGEDPDRAAGGRRRMYSFRRGCCCMSILLIRSTPARRRWAAAAYIDEHRRPGEPVIACSPLVMFPTQYHHGTGKAGSFAAIWGQDLPLYAGGSAPVAR